MLEILLGFTCVLALVLLAFRSEAMNRWALVAYGIAYLGAIGSGCLASAGCLVLPWVEHLTAFFAIDPLNLIFLAILAVVFLPVSIYNLGYRKGAKGDRSSGTFYAVFMLLFMASMTGAVASTHLALYWVFLEATTLASSYLIYFPKTKASLEATWKYIFICSIGIAVAFVGIVFISVGSVGFDSLFLADLYRNAPSMTPLWLKLGFVFITIGLGTKVGLAPVHAWLPDAHSEAPSPVSALLSGTLLNTALLGMMRAYKLMGLAGFGSQGRIILLVLGFLSLVVTAAFILGIRNYKRMLAYSSIENMGIVAVGLGLGGPAILAALFHVAAHSLVKSPFFLTAGNILRRFGTKDTREISGLVKADPLNGWLWVAFCVAILGFPPSPVFMSEYLMISAFVSSGRWLLLAVFLLLLTVILYGMGRRVFAMSFGEPVMSSDSGPVPVSMVLPLFIFIALFTALGSGIFAPLFGLFADAAEVLK
jgi:hydrogenase-4 component F